MVLQIEETLYSRDEKGILIPQEVELEVDENNPDEMTFKGETIFVTPMPRGKLRRLMSSVVKEGSKEEKDLDGDVILEHCVNPKYEKEDIPFIKPALANAIVNTIFRESGMTPSSSRKKALKKVEDEFAKNSKRSNEIDKKAI